MRIFLIIFGVLGVITFIIIVGLVILFSTLMNRYGPVTEEATAYTNESIRAIATEWDRDALTSRASPELVGVLTDASVDQLISFGRNQLGSMTTYEDNASCMINRLEIGTYQGEFALAECSATAEFENASGSFKIGAVKRNEEWKLTAFYIDGKLRENGRIRTADVSPLNHLTSFEISFSNRFLALESEDIDILDVGVSSGDALYREFPDSLEQAADQLE